MPLQKIQLRPGLNREGTDYSNEGGYFDGDKIRFRSGFPEKLGGWIRLSASRFLGVARSIWNWATLAGFNYLGIGTNLKYYVESGGYYYDITPIRTAAVLSNPFATVNASTTVTVTDVAHGAVTGDFVTFSNVATVGGLNLNAEFQITVTDADIYTITATAATSTATGGGTTVQAVYQINTGLPFETPLTGWGAGAWNVGASCTSLTLATRASSTSVKNAE
jgi:hypothetical protein